MYLVILVFFISVSEPTFAKIERIIISGKGGLTDYSGFILYIKKGTKFPKFENTKDQIEISQINKQFNPKVAAVSLGFTINFKKYDEIFHNVFSLTPGNQFDLGLYKGSQAYVNEIKRKSSNQGINSMVSFSNPGKVNVF